MNQHLKRLAIGVPPVVGFVGLVFWKPVWILGGMVVLGALGAGYIVGYVVEDI